jgi:hypothetical protein
MSRKLISVLKKRSVSGNDLVTTLELMSLSLIIQDRSCLVRCRRSRPIKGAACLPELLQKSHIVLCRNLPKSLLVLFAAVSELLVLELERACLNL